MTYNTQAAMLLRTPRILIMMQGSACKHLFNVMLCLLCKVAMSMWDAAEAASVVLVLGNVQKCSAEGGLSDPLGMLFAAGCMHLRQ